MTATLRPGSRVTITSTYSTTAHLNGTAATVLEVSARTYRVRPDGWSDRLSQWLPHAEVTPLPCPACHGDHATKADPMGALIDCLRRAVTAAGPDAGGPA